MAVPATVEEFLDLVRKSGVVDEKRLDAFLAKARAALPSDPAKAAGTLVQNGILTNFQAENILAGKWRRFSIGKYKVLERLGSGGFAQVYLCEHKLMRRRVAVKVLPIAKARDSSALERFYREARAVAALDHPNIVHAYDIDQDEDLHFLVMEYVDGSNLLEIVKRGGALSVVRACHYIQQAASALQHAHENGLVHRDIKPGNILVDRTGVVKVLDMGLALFFRHDEDDQLTRRHDDGTLGTADYLSPEQAMDSHDVDIRTDIYSLGVTFYFLLTGKAPFEGLPVAQKLLAHQMRAPKPLSEFRKDVPAGVQAILDKMMAKNVNHRYAVPGELVDALVPFTQTEIAPPSDVEMPKLSPAATGSTNEFEVKSETKRTPPGMNKVIKSPLPAPVPAPAPAPATTRSAAAVAAPPLPKAKAEPAPWEHQVDTDPSPAAFDTPTMSPSEKNKLSPAAVRRRTILTIVLVVAFIVLPSCLVATVFSALWLFSKNPEPTPRPGPRHLHVSKDPNRKNAQTSIQAAVKLAEIDSIIELWDDVYEENVVIEPIRGRTSMTLQAGDGKEIVWRSSKSEPDEPILRVRKGPGFKLKGKGITFDGALEKDRRVNDLIVLNLESAGLTLENLQLKNFARSAIFIMNSGGKADAPMRLSGLQIFSDAADRTRGAIYFDANAKVTPSANDHIEITDCRFHGFDNIKAIQVRPPRDHKEEPVNGLNIKW